MSGALRASLSLAVVALFAWAVESFVGWRAVAAAWLHVPLSHAAGAVLLLVASYACRGARLHAYLGTATATFPAALRVTLIHNAANHILPFRTGEVTLPVLLNRTFGVGPAASVGALVWFRLLDFAFIIAAGAAALALRPGTRWMGVLALVALAPFALAAARKRMSASLASAGLHGRARAILAELIQAVPQTRRRFWIDGAWTGAGWISKIAALALVMLAFAPITAPDAVLATLAGELTSVLPVHAPGGFGTYEAGLVGAMVYAGVALGPAIAAAVNVHLALLSTALLCGCLALVVPNADRAV